MKLETFLTTYTHNAESIIQWVFLAVLLMVGFLIARGLFGKKEAAVAVAAAAGPGVSVAPPAELQAVLDKIMAQTAKLETVQLTGMAPAGVAEIEAQVQTLKNELSSREVEIAELKAAGPSPVATDAGNLAERIKELEAKLAEYEILEDDIADLSLYKEENSRLKAELDGIRAAPAPVAAAVAVAAAPAPPAEPEPVLGESIVEEFAQAVAQPTPEVSTSAPPLDVPDTGDPMKDFESTLQMTAPEPVAAPAAASAQAEADDLFAEFAQGEDSSTLDTEKMMAEMAALVNIEPTGGNALDESIDIEKMASEAGRKS